MIYLRNIFIFFQVTGALIISLIEILIIYIMEWFLKLHNKMKL